MIASPKSLPKNAPVAPGNRAWTVPQEHHRRPLDGVVRALAGVSWSAARGLVETGKIRVAGELALDPERAVRAGDQLTLTMSAPRPRTARLKAVEQDLLIHVDASIIVVRKPAGLSTVPFGDEDPEDQTATLDALVRDLLAKKDKLRGRAPLGVVQRLDKVTSGVLVFARTLAAKKHLAQQLRLHTVHRRYLAIAHGKVEKRTFRSHLVADRGDRLRGSAPDGRREGQLAVTHVEPVEALRGATLVACRLETGRTHQIRIHLAEAGHPLVGETVYIRDYLRQQQTPIPAPRLMLHAAELGFQHPADDRPVRFEDPPPLDFLETLRRLSLGEPPAR